jgi:hypothetical protein
MLRREDKKCQTNRELDQDCMRFGRYLKTSYARGKMMRLQVSDLDIVHVIKFETEAYRPEDQGSNDCVQEVNGPSLDGRQLRITLEFNDGEIVLLTVM